MAFCMARSISIQVELESVLACGNLIVPSGRWVSGITLQAVREMTRQTNRMDKERTRRREKGFITASFFK
jgi:hypothetical protein